MTWKDYIVILQPELFIIAIIVVLLLIKIGSDGWGRNQFLYFINALLLLNFLGALVFQPEGHLFHEMYKANRLTNIEKSILSAGVLLISLQSWSWLKFHKHAEEFYMLLLSSLLGMFFMISSNNLLQFYLGLELSTIPLAAICNFDLDKRESSESAMKLILNSAFSSGLLLMGISFVYGATGSLNFTEITPKLESSTLLLFAFVLLTSGFGFKISAVPFHLWTADVYQGAPVPVTSYLSVISKGSLFFVFVSVLYTLFKPLSNDWYPVICLLAILTMVVGNLFALRQTNIKRLLAFSSIAQAGFILVGISANSVVGLSSVVYFILVYIFSNLGAFGVVSVISACTGKENINDYRGLYKTNPLLAWVLAISLFSLAGIPPTAGFFGKFFLLIAGAARNNYSLIIIAALNMVVSLYYYLVLVKTIFLNGDDSKMETLPIPMLSRIALLICVAGILVLGLYGNVYDYIQSVCSNF